VSESEIDALLEDEAAEELPPEPGEEGDLRVAPLAVREAAKLAGMSPEQRERYDAAQAQIMSHPAVQAFSEAEELHAERMKVYKAEFLKAQAKKAKE
jgi:uncharacterized protein YbaA (DUF1428 family)